MNAPTTQPVYGSSMPLIQDNTILAVAPIIGLNSHSLGLIMDFDSEKAVDTIVGLKWAISLTGDNSEKWTKIIQCESGWRTDVYGDNGLAFGILQFHKRTWDIYTKKYGLEFLDYKNPYDQILLAETMVRDNPTLWNSWTCYLR